jgi:hypothetical protein
MHKHAARLLVAASTRTRSTRTVSQPPLDLERSARLTRTQADCKRAVERRNATRELERTKTTERRRRIATVLRRCCKYSTNCQSFCTSRAVWRLLCAQSTSTEGERRKPPYHPRWRFDSPMSRSDVLYANDLPICDVAGTSPSRQLPRRRTSAGVVRMRSVGFVVTSDAARA